MPLRIQDLDSLEYFPFGVLFAHERATRTAPSACQSTGGFARLLSTRPRRITTDLQFSDRPSQHNLIPLSMQDLHSLEYFPFGILLARERATRTALSACQPTWDFAGLGYFPHVHIALPLTYSSWIGHYSTILPSHIQNLDSLEYLSFGVLFARERATCTAPSACQPTGGFARLLPTRPRRITTDLQFSDGPSQHNLIPLRMQDLDSHEHFPFGVLFSRERATRTNPSACQPTGDFAGLLPTRARRVTIDLQFSDRPL